MESSNYHRQEPEDVHSSMQSSNLEKNRSTAKWHPGTWQDGTRESAFLPYKPTPVLTNFQRGNIPAENSTAVATASSFFHQAGQGEITSGDLGPCLDIDLPDSKGLNALMWASSYGQLATVELLLRRGANVDHEGFKGATSLLLAAANGHHNVVRLLILYGATIDHVDDFDNSALMFAAFGDHSRCAKELLVGGANVTLENCTGDTAFQIAVAQKNRLTQEVFEKFLVSMLN